MNKNKASEINTLFVIGNGFDIYHGYNSRYSDFQKFLVGYNYDLTKALERYLIDGDELWADFEEALASLNTDQLLEDFEESLISYGADDWSDSYHHEFQDYIEDEIKKLTIDMKSSFCEWISNLYPGVYYDEDGYEVDEGEDEEYEIDNILSVIQKQELCSSFLNFNYTNSLESLYGISSSKIKHIHGKSREENSSIILGHGVNPKHLAQKFVKDEDGSWDGDPRVNNVIELFIKYYKKNSKPTKKIIKLNKEYFQSLKTITEVYVLGHSLSDVDLLYFKEIISHIDSSNVKWKISYYGDYEKRNHKITMKNLGIKSENIELITFEDIR